MEVWRQVHLPSDADVFVILSEQVATDRQVKRVGVVQGNIAKVILTQKHLPDLLDVFFVCGPVLKPKQVLQHVLLLSCNGARYYVPALEAFDKGTHLLQFDRSFHNLELALVSCPVDDSSVFDLPVIVNHDRGGCYHCDIQIGLLR